MTIHPDILMLGLLLGCSDGPGLRPVDPCAPDQEVELSVSAELAPLFTWTPSCGMASLQVWDHNHTSGWSLFTGSRAAQNPLQSGIRYGEAPPLALEPGPPAPLVNGTYMVTVYRWIGDASGGSLIPVGEATFER